MNHELHGITIIPVLMCHHFCYTPGIMTTHCLAVTGGGSIGKCGRLSRLAFSSHYNTHTYLLACCWIVSAMDV